MTPSPTPTPVVTGPRLIEAEQGWLKFTVHLPSEPDLAAKPVSHLLYTTTDIPRAYTTTLWLAEVGDITHRQVITAFYNRRGYATSLFSLSPAETWLIYASLREDAFMARLTRINLNTKKQTL